jgi:hypothetical protein
MVVMEVVEAATPAAGEFLEVCAVFVAVVGLWFGLGFHGVGGEGFGGDQSTRTTRPEPFGLQSDLRPNQLAPANHKFIAP